MRPLLAGVVVLLAGVRVAADQPALLFPTGDDPAPLHLNVADNGRPPDVAWGAFLDRLFDHFDRDGDGTLSAAEAGRVFALPLPGGGEVAINFQQLDADKDGKGSRTEFRDFYRTAGFTPVVVVVQPAPDETLRTADALFHHLDRDGDGSLSAAELRQAPALLRRLDENEDEVLTAAELLALPRPGPTAAAGLTLGKAAHRTPPHATLGLNVGGRAALSNGGREFGLSDGSRLRVPGGTCVLTATADNPLAGFRAAKDFYLSQFRTAGDKPAKKVFEDDPAAQVLAGLFDAADRDGDGKLTQPELEAFLDLIERGVGCRVLVTATDRGRNLFDLFDRTGDGRLDAAELTRAGRDLAFEFAKEKPLARNAVPGSYRLSVSRGPVGESFGPVPFGVAGKPKPRNDPAPARGPQWFRAQDRNGDGFVSAQEFVGSPELFKKLDADGDGRISPDEAAAAGR